MKLAEPVAIHLKDYQPPVYHIRRIALDFTLEPEATRVVSTMQVERRGPANEPLVLDGDGLKLLWVKLDGAELKPSDYALDAHTLTIRIVPAQFTLEIATEIAPAKNTALEGLYMSNGIYCTQCEPEGFRCITYYLDRPDNLAVFETRVEADKATHPILLSNGNPIEQGDLPNGRHFVRWQDPFPKPSYLFALVAGDLGSIRDDFTTMTGRKIDLRIYVEHGNENRAYYAMDALKRSMKWDEEVYGREYDLDIFMIVAVSAFNFGAMENKGLNIFNDKVLLASPETATDDDYTRIESVVAHEYFHNWSGDRITCRDWFQISLKEGLTVYREYGFSGDQRSRAVRRISDVKDLRLRQFQEDSGPLAHPVQPASYITIDNFYTATIYEKGAEIIGMIHTLMGPQDFRKGMDLYFSRHDGEAATVEDFVRCFEDVSGRDLQQFRLWYSQAGTPHLKAEGAYDAKAQTYTLTLSQRLAPTPGQSDKKAMQIPVSIGLIGKKTGKALVLRLQDERVGGLDRVVELNTPQQSYVFIDVAEEPVLSINRNFSAPVVVDAPADRGTRAFLLRNDTDAFNRWEASQKLACDVLMEMIAAIQRGETPKADPVYLEAIGRVLERASEDPAFTAQILMPPTEQELALAMTVIDPDAIHAARVQLIRAVAAEHGPTLEGLYYGLRDNGAFQPDAASAGRRALRNSALRYLTATDDDKAAAMAFEHYQSATNMTDSIAGLGALTRMQSPKRQQALDDFHERFKNDLLVLDKWMGLQAMAPTADTLERVRELMKHNAFSMKNPNRVRALVGAFSTGNPLRFHDKSGAGYALVAEVALALDAINPQTAARMITVFETWKRYDLARQGLIRAELEKIRSHPNLSPNLFEVVTKILG